MLRVDVAVVGGGPAGARVAREAARGKLRVVLLERAPRAPLRCAGIISLRAQGELGIPERFVLERLRGVVVHGPEGREVTLTATSPKAVVIDRVEWDRYLREEAKDAGAMVWEGVAALGWGVGVLLTSRGRIAARWLVGADGATSGVAAWAGLPRPKEILVGYQAEVATPPRYPGHAEIFLDPGIAPGSFAWAVPAGDTVRVGLLAVEGKGGHTRLRALLKRVYPAARVVSYTAGLVPIGPPEVTSRDGVFLVGDAAAQVKPLTGGGIYYGGLAAEMLGRLLAQGTPEGYEAAWRGKLEAEIRFGLRARKAFLSLSPAELGYLVSLLGEAPLQEFLLSRGDMDRPSHILRELRRAPHLWPLGLKALNALGGLSRFAEFLR